MNLCDQWPEAFDECLWKALIKEEASFILLNRSTLMNHRRKQSTAQRGLVKTDY